MSAVCTEFGVDVVNLPTQNVAVAVQLPREAAQFHIQARTGVDLKVSRVDGGAYFTVKSGTILYLERMSGEQTLWIQSGTADVNVEIFWQK